VRALGWLVLLLVALLADVWRQPRAVALLEQIRGVETQHAMVESERVELVRRIEELRSRTRILRVAHDRLGMHLAADTEIVFLPAPPEADSTAGGRP
jgi:hypothetical protein